ncbi:MAG TPA: PIN domain-containing protein [candidate division Zixibacteria bacterium]|nr:PIN domain-containing protein [candidate division Zixibacteria bacterium]
MAVLVDTSVLYALARREDPWHTTCEKAIASEPEAVIVPAHLLCEIAYLVNVRIGAAAERAFLRGLFASDWAVEPMNQADLDRAVDLLEQYAGADIGFVDAATVAIAERLGVKRIYTLDRRDFSVVRPAHVPAFELLP